MDSPISIVVAEIVKQNIKEQALATHKHTLPYLATLCWRYYLGSTYHMHKYEIEEFHEHLSKQNADI